MPVTCVGCHRDMTKAADSLVSILNIPFNSLIMLATDRKQQWCQGRDLVDKRMKGNATCKSGR